MRAFVPRAVLAAAVALTAAGCAAGAGGAAAGGSPGSATDGGRYRVMVPALEVTGGAAANVGTAIARDLRNYIAEMETHSAVAEGDITRAMRQYNVGQLDLITARQLAQQINARLVTWGTVQQGGAGLTASLQVVDVPSGDEFILENITGANPRELSQAIYQQFQQKIQGIRLAAFCQDDLASQQFNEALERCTRAIEIVPTSSMALYGLATAYLNLDRDEEALTTYRRLLQADATHQDALLGAGLAASRTEQGQEALGYYMRYMELNPGDPQIRLTVAGRIAETGDFPSAFRVLQPAMAENEGDLDFQRYLAQVATAAGQSVRERESPAAAREYFETALAAYGRVIATDTALDAATMRQVMAVNIAMDRTDEALRIGQRATQQFDTVSSLWMTYGDVLRQANRHADAVRAYSRVIDLDPRAEGVFIRRAMSQIAAGNRAAGVADLERVARDPAGRQQAAQVIMGIAGEAYRANNFAEAGRYFEMAQSYADGQQRRDATYFLSASLFRQGDAIARANTQGNAARAREALNFFERALTLSRQSGHPEAGQIISASEQYIANQRAIIQAATGR